MSKSPAKFTNERLVEVFCDVFAQDGTRRDVVVALMGEMDPPQEPSDDKLYGQMYNSVTQRMRHLSNRDKNPVTFPALQEGRRGSSHSTSALQDLQAKLDAAVKAKNGDADTEGEPAPADEGEQAPE